MGPTKFLGHENHTAESQNLGQRALYGHHVDPGQAFVGTFQPAGRFWSTRRVSASIRNTLVPVSLALGKIQVRT
jgi:hypothetical protein